MVGQLQPAPRVARRALCLTAVVRRGLIEYDVKLLGKPGAAHEAASGGIRDWARQEQVRAEISRHEEHLLRGSNGFVDPLRTSSTPAGGGSHWGPSPGPWGWLRPSLPTTRSSAPMWL